MIDIERDIRVGTVATIGEAAALAAMQGDATVVFTVDGDEVVLWRKAAA